MKISYRSPFFLLKILLYTKKIGMYSLFVNIFALDKNQIHMILYTDKL